jgi:lysozyme
MTENDFDTLKRMLMCDEGVAFKPYRDNSPSACLTIGVGRNLDRTLLNDNEIHLMLENDILKCYALLSREYDFFSKLTAPRQCALLNLCFNVGFNGCKKFAKMWKAIEAGDYKLAAQEMINSKWRKQVGERAERLAYIMEMGCVKDGWYTEFRKIG